MNCKKMVKSEINLETKDKLALFHFRESEVSSKFAM